MKFSITAAIAAALAIAATTASAGVVITQKLNIKNQEGAKKFERTVMVQGHKQKVITGDHQVITDLDAGKIYIIKPSTKEFIQAPFPPQRMIINTTVPEGIAVGFKKAGTAPRKLNGYKCQDYNGGSTVAHLRVGIIECVASDAPGAKEFTEYQRAVADKLKGTLLAQVGEVPDGIPVSSIINLTGTAEAMTGGISPEQLAKLQADLDKKPTITAMNVSKIEAKDLPAAEFVVPADFTNREIPKPQLGKVPVPGAPAAPAPPKPH
jgi:hypothetical protein